MVSHCSYRPSHLVSIIFYNPVAVTYFSLNISPSVASIGLMCSVIDVLSKWMASNRLLLNPSKTQFIWLDGRRQLAKVDLRRLCWPIPFPMLHSQPRFVTLV